MGGKFTILLGLVSTLAFSSTRSINATPIQVYGVWHAGNDECVWGTVRDMTNFDQNNHWIIDRGDGVPAVNLVILSFVQPLNLLNMTSDAQTTNGVPLGMTPAIVSYFTSHGIRVMLSIGGETYVGYWDSALATITNATRLGLNAAAVAKQLGVGMEIDYEGSSATSIANLRQFVNAYRSMLPYDATGNNPAARLTIDLGAGDRYLTALEAEAGSLWLSTTNPVLDYANAMVPSRQPGASTAESDWQEHISGNSRMTPPIPPLAPCKLTGSLFLTASSVTAECNNFPNSVQLAAANWVETVAPAGAGTTPGMLGYMFWAAECEGTRTQCTTPPNTCDGGLGAGSQYFSVQIPMPALRQDNGFVAPPALQSAGRMSDLNFKFNVTGTPGYSCVVQASTNLTDWITMQTNALPFIFTDSLAPDFPIRYYRAFVSH